MKPLVFDCAPFSAREMRATSLAVSESCAAQIREIAYKTRRSVKEITDELLIYALSNVELRETPVYETHYPENEAQPHA